jgi:hypothetical protein
LSSVMSLLYCYRALSEIIIKDVVLCQVSVILLPCTQ